MDVLLLVLSLAVILIGANLFTNGIEWVGEQHGLPEGAVGSVLAAVGTALPETILPLVAISFGGKGAEEIGIGAILGAPFMLTTLAMFVLGVAVLIFSRGGRRSRELDGDDEVLAHDLGFFLGMYSVAFLAGIIHVRVLHILCAVGLVVAYVVYVRHHFGKPSEDEVERETEGEIRELYFSTWLRRGRAWDKRSPMGWTYGQVVVALALIVGGAKVFVVGMGAVATALAFPYLIFALLIAPFATELPEKMNSVIWVRRKKDTLALGNLTGAMVFQSAFPVSVGLLFTTWRLNTDALVAALIALLAGTTLYVTTRIRGKFQAWLLLLQGVFYAGYVAWVVARVVNG
jgi:cation:H+ antiporter